MIKIKDFSIKVGYSIRMLRYLEDMGLIVPRRDSNNYRTYLNSQVFEAKKIKTLQALGLQFKEIEKIFNENKVKQIEILEKVLTREIEISEIKSSSIPELKFLLSLLKADDRSLESYFSTERKAVEKINIVGNDLKFERIAYKIPILKSIYEDHLCVDADIELIATDLIVFRVWLENIDYNPSIYSAFQNTSFAFGKEISENFKLSFEKSWKKYLPAIELKQEESFTREDIIQLMGPHDILIRTIFKYKNTGIAGEFLIPYTPVYAISQISNRSIS